MENKDRAREKLREIFENTIESGLKYSDSISNINYFGLQCKAAENDQLYDMFGNNMCMFNYRSEKDDYIMMLFSIPINSSEEVGKKSVSERVMEVIEELERCFITIDKVQTETVQEDKHIYITALKLIE